MNYFGLQRFGTGAVPTQAEFAALVTAHNTLLANHNSLVTAFNSVLQVLRDHNLIED